MRRRGRASRRWPQWSALQGGRAFVEALEDPADGAGKVGSAVVGIGIFAGPDQNCADSFAPPGGGVGGGVSNQERPAFGRVQVADGTANQAAEGLAAAAAVGGAVGAVVDFRNQDVVGGERTEELLVYRDELASGV